MSYWHYNSSFVNANIKCNKNESHFFLKLNVLLLKINSNPSEGLRHLHEKPVIWCTPTKLMLSNLRAMFDTCLAFLLQKELPSNIPSDAQ